MDKELQISCTIVAYRNDPGELLEAISSFLSSPLRVEVTVVDNSPDERLGELVKRSGAEYSHAGKNLGFGAAHNVGMVRYLESSEYHLIMNPDVRFGPEVLVALYDFMQSDRKVGLAMPRVLYPDGREQNLCKRLPTPLDLIARRFGGQLSRRLLRRKLERYHLTTVDLSRPSIVPCLSGCFMLVRTDLLSSEGLFDERFFMYMEDVDLCRRIGQVSKTVFYPGVSIYHGYAKGSYKDTTLMKYHLQSAWKYFWKWGWIRDKSRDRLNESMA